MLLENHFFYLIFSPINADSSDDVEMKLGTDNAIKYASRMNAPAYIAPSSASADIYQKEIQAIEDTINKVAYDLTTNQRDNNLK